MANNFNSIRRVIIASMSLLAWQFYKLSACANPTGGTVTQGGATINSSGSHLTVTTSGNTAINWQSFNIGLGETTTFVEPTSSSIVWNYVNSGSPSQILGNLNANGFVILQNAAGFYIGGQACIATHGLMMTTAPIAMPNLNGGGAWQFDAPPPSAKIINYGQINIAGGGSAFLLADDIENNGTISAPGGNIGLYAGQKVLVSTSPDGRSLSAEVTLPLGSVDNNGKLIADAGSIALQAQTVNQNGLVQANSVQNVGGVIELVASEAVNLGANSTISAQGDSQGISAGGNVTVKSGDNFADQAGSSVNISGGEQGGDGGQVEISAPNMASIQSSINGQAASGFINGSLTIDPLNIQLVSSSGTGTSGEYSSGTVNPSDPPTAGTLVLNVNSFSSTLSQINLQAIDDIELSTVWTLADPGMAANLKLSAGNNIILDDGSAISAGHNWSVSLAAGTSLAAGSIPTSGNAGIYLNGNSYIQTQNGDINLSAFNEVIVNDGAVRTLGGGNIFVTTQYGDVNSGDNINGYNFAPHSSIVSGNPPYYTVNAANLGGISTAAGGNVTIAAGGDVISYLPVQSDYTDAQHDAGTGAFGSQPGNVTITAGGNVYGHYVLANGVGTITAGGNIGAPLTDQNLDADSFALSLVKGSWNIYAPNGNIDVQDIRNPNGIFDDANYAGYHYFDYDAQASVLLDAGGSVEITGEAADAPHSPNSAGGTSIPIILPSELQVIAGGDFTLDTSIILSPSPNQKLDLNIGGNFVGIPNGNPIDLEMSDSAGKSWAVGADSFGTTDHAAAPLEINNPNTVNIEVGKDMDDINLYTTMASTITVGGNMNNCGLVGENLHASDITSINVTGEIYDSPLYTFVSLSSPIASANPLQSSAWDSIFDFAINPALISQLTSLNVTAIEQSANGLAYYLKANNYLLFPGSSGNNSTYGSNPGFIYDPSSKQLGFQGNMSAALSSAQVNLLEGGTFTVLKVNAQGIPIVDAQGHLETTTYTFSPASSIANLYQESLNASSTSQLGYQIGGPGQFIIKANSMDLGNSPGIQSLGFGGDNYASLENVCGTLNAGGASIFVEILGGDLDMVTSSIDSIDGGNVTVQVDKGALNLSEGDFDFQNVDCYGIYTSGHSDVKVTADGDINVGSARIASFNGGNVFVESYNGDVNAGNGANKALAVFGFYIDPSTGLPSYVEFGDLTDPTSLQVNPAPYGSGILAEAPTKKYLTPGGNQTAGGDPLPGNITVLTPNGNILSSAGGISQFALDGNVSGGPTVTLNAGTAGIAATADQGNITLGGPVLGVNINVTATGKISGFFISQNALDLTGETIAGIGLGKDVTASAQLPSDGPTLTIVGVNSVSANGVGKADLLGQNVSTDGGKSQSTLGASASATSTSQAAAQQSNQVANQQVADNDTPDDKKKGQPVLKKTKRVTVILPKAS